MGVTGEREKKRKPRGSGQDGKEQRDKQVAKRCSLLLLGRTVPKKLGWDEQAGVSLLPPKAKLMAERSPQEGRAVSPTSAWERLEAWGLDNLGKSANQGANSTHMHSYCFKIHSLGPFFLHGQTWAPG